MKDELGWKLEKLYFDFFLFYGEFLFVKDEIGGFVIRDVKLFLVDIFVFLYGIRVFNLVCYNFWIKINFFLFIIFVFNNLIFLCRLEVEGIFVYFLNVYDCLE